MRVIAVRRPYPAATGVQFDVEHTNGRRVHAVYQDVPFDPAQLLAVPFFLEDTGILSYRTRDWWAYCLEDRLGCSTIYDPARALQAAQLVAKEYIALHGVPTPLMLDQPLTLETAQEVLEVYAHFVARAGSV